MAGAVRELTGGTVPLLAAALPRYAARQHQAAGRTMAHRYGLRFFLFEADGTLRRLPLRTLQGMVRDEDRMPQYAGKRLRVADAWLAFADSIYNRLAALLARFVAGLALIIVRRAAGSTGFVVQPRRWVVERSLS